MNKKLFWMIIEKTLDTYEGDSDSYVAVLKRQLSSLSVEDVVKWDQLFSEYLEISNREKLRAAAYLMNDGCDEDGFDYFRAWLISLGKDRFLAALKDPDSLGDLTQVHQKEYVAEFEELIFVAEEAFAVIINPEGKMTEDEIEDAFLDQLDTKELKKKEKENMYQEIEFDKDSDIEWDEDDEETLRRMFPKLSSVLL